ncbi:MAG: DUF1800 family protein, partial [Planctomycetota bacterium]
MQRQVTLLIALVLIACGSGGIEALRNDDAPSPRPSPGPAPAPASAGEASRFLSQATFGGNLDEINTLAAAGDYAAWIEAQRALPVTYMSDAVQELHRRFDPEERTRAQLRAAGIPFLVEEGEVFPIFDWEFVARFAWWTTVFRAPDQLRQKVAYALSQIVVVSDLTDETSRGEVMGAYFDILQRHALGSYRELLDEITYSTGMGLYLTHMANDKGDPARGIFPDENYARELMQLFTIGLWQLEQDGSRKLDGNGQPIPTYTNADITELARVMTGLGPNGGDVFTAIEPEDHRYDRPMAVWEEHHATGPKRLIDGSFTDGTTAEDIDAALDALVNHPNTAPFISKQLIQRLVSSNPSPAYVGRVAAVFADNGNGERGDLGAVVRAILLDPETRDPARHTERTGKIREPVLRYIQLLKAFELASESGLLLNPGFRLLNLNPDPEESPDLRQRPLAPPSVFNFYRPDYQPPTLAGTGLVSPESQIIHAATVSGYNSLLREVLIFGEPMESIVEEELIEMFPNGDLEDHVPELEGIERFVPMAADARALA